MSTEATQETPARQARLLLRAARAGTLATAVDGQPFASLVTPATAGDASVLLLLSGLSEHTRHLQADPRCSILVSGVPAGANPQTAPRLTITGLATLEPDTGLKARWVALHPYAAFYAGFGDFTLWRVQPLAGLFIGGFASAHRLKRAELAADPDAVAALNEAEAGVVAHCNGDHPDALDAIAAAHLPAEHIDAANGDPGTGWRMVACDVDGCDLARDDHVLRIAWSAPVSGPGGIRTELVRLAHAARNPLEPTARPPV